MAIKYIVDVSSYNGTVNWASLKSKGVTGGILKIIRKDLARDNQFNNNYKGVIAQKMPWGVYNYSYATTVAKAQSDMKLVCDILDKLDTSNMKYGVWFDIEDASQAYLSKAKFADIINAAQKVVEARGYKFGVYTGMAYYKAHMDGAGIDCKNWWIARYYNGYNKMKIGKAPNESYKPTNPANICAWQYSSSVIMPATGNGGVGDMSVLYKEPTGKTAAKAATSAVSTTSTTSTKTTTTTGVTAEDVLKIMRGWIGLSRAKGTHKPIIDTYNAYKPLARNYKVTYTDEYCATTVSAAFIKANAVSLIGGTECSVERFIEDVFKKKGIWNEDGTITPKIGDIICYNWDDTTQPNDGWADHIGVVETVNTSAKTFVVIEGNMNGVVGRRTVKFGYGQIRGFARPKYATASKTTTTTTTTTTTAKETSSTGAPSKAAKWVGQVTATRLNVRTWAGTENGNIKAYPLLAKGNKVDVCDTIKDSEGTDWYYVRIEGKYYGFVSSKYIKKVS